MTKQLTPFGALGAIRRTMNLTMALVLADLGYWGLIYFYLIAAS
jgi:hypothetical protein